MMMRKMSLVVMLLCAISAMAETPLAKLYRDMDSDDPKIKAAAKAEESTIMDREFPTIEKDTEVLCSTLVTAKDSYVRLQSAAILVTILMEAPEHTQVVIACTPQLIVTAQDHGEAEADPTNSELLLRRDSLTALAMLPGGPPPQAHQVLLAALTSPALSIQKAGGFALVREKSENRAHNQDLVKEALLSAPDSIHRVSLLEGIFGNGVPVPSKTLYDAAQQSMFASDSDVQQAAIEVMGVTAVDKGELLNALQNIVNSPVAPREVKDHAKGVIARRTK